MNQDHQEKLSVIGASLFLTMVAIVGAGLVVAHSAGKPFEIASGVAFVLSVLVAVYNTTWLLVTPSADARVLTRGRRLVWLAFVMIAVAGALGCVAMALG